MPRRVSSPLPLIAACCAIALLAGCGSSSFLGQRFDNFTARYNLFYNAEHAFEKALEARRGRDVRIDPADYLVVYPEEQGTEGRGDFEKTIEKGADLLRKHPGSKWVDDALMLIGRSYYYTGNFIGAEQKFREVRAAASPLAGEAEVWLARALMRKGDLDDALAVARAAIVNPEVPARRVARMQLIEAEVAVGRSEWARAAAALSAALPDLREPELEARARFLLAQVQETLGRPAEAAETYASIARLNPPYELSFAAQTARIRTLAAAGDADRARALLARMQRDDKHFAYRAQLDLLEGRVLAASGRTGEARDVLDALLYGDEPAPADVAGRAHYALAELYRSQLGDYVLAAAHYDTAATALGGRGGRRGARTEQRARTPEAISDVAERRDVFSSYARVFGDVARLDSLLALGALDDSTFDARVLAMRRTLADEMATQRREAEAARLRERFGGEFGGGTTRQGSGKQIPGKETTTTGDGAGSDAGFLFHRDPTRVQAARIEFNRRWGNRPHVPNWRRIEAVQGGGEVADRREGGAGRDAELAVDASDALPEIDVSAVPRSPQQRAAMVAERAALRYELGNVLFLSVGRPDSAAAWYRKVIEDEALESELSGDDADETALDVARRAYYALAEVQRALGDTLAARRLQGIVLDRFPESTIAAALRGEKPTSVESDSLAAARAAYARASALWQAERPREAFRALLSVAAGYPDTDAAPQALFAAAHVLADIARADSLRPTDPVRVDLPDSLLARFGAAAPKPDTLDALVPPDSLAAPPVPALRVRDLYASLSERYPESPYAAAARRRIEAFDLVLADADSLRSGTAAGKDAAAPDASPRFIPASERALSKDRVDGKEPDKPVKAVEADERPMPRLRVFPADSTARRDSSGVGGEARPAPPQLERPPLRRESGEAEPPGEEEPPGGEEPPMRR